MGKALGVHKPLGIKLVKVLNAFLPRLGLCRIDHGTVIHDKMGIIIYLAPAAKHGGQILLAQVLCPEGEGDLISGITVSVQIIGLKFL